MTEAHALVERFLIPTQLGLAMLGMGAALEWGDFGRVFRDPRGLALGLGVQLVAVPLMALAFVETFRLSGGWAVGLFLVAVIPGGAYSNLLTFIGRGNTALSISTTVVSTLGCVITIPILLSLLAGSQLPDGFGLPAGRMVAEIAAFVLLPLAAGLWLRRRREALAGLVSRWAVRIAVGLIGVITVSAVASGRIEVAEYGALPPALITLFGVTLAVLVPRLAGFLRFDNGVVVAVGVEATVRNVPLALLLVHFFFPGSPEQDHVLYTCLFYAGLSMMLSLPMVLRHRAGLSPFVLRRRPVAS